MSQMGCHNAPVRLDILFLSHHSQTDIYITYCSVCLSPTKCCIESTRHTLPTSTYYATETHQAHLIRLEYDFVESGFLVSGPSHNVLVITGDVTAQD